MFFENIKNSNEYFLIVKNCSYEFLRMFEKIFRCLCGIWSLNWNENRVIDVLSVKKCCTNSRSKNVQYLQFYFNVQKNAVSRSEFHSQYKKSTRTMNRVSQIGRNLRVALDFSIFQSTSFWNSAALMKREPKIFVQLAGCSDEKKRKKT